MSLSDFISHKTFYVALVLLLPKHFHLSRPSRDISDLTLTVIESLKTTSS